MRKLFQPAFYCLADSTKFSDQITDPRRRKEDFEAGSPENTGTAGVRPNSST